MESSHSFPNVTFVLGAEEALLYRRGRIATFFKKLAHLCGSTEIIRVVTAELPKSKKLRIRIVFLNMYWM